MLNTFIKLSRAFFILLAGCSFAINSQGQTTLIPGDIAFTGYHASLNSPQSDRFSFVLLRNMNANTIIHFTENGWGNDGIFHTGENTLSFTLGVSSVAGTEIIIAGVPSSTTIVATLAGGASAGTCTGNMLSLSVSGDQVIAYQSTSAGVAPFTFISAILMNVYEGGSDPSLTDAANWDNLPASTQTVNSSFKPTVLTTGTNAIWIGTQGVGSSRRNNARFNCNTAIAGGANLTTIAGVRAACNNQAFWDSELAVSGAAPTWPLPSSCNFVGSALPVKLSSFSVKNLISFMSLDWTTTAQVNFSHFDVERQYDDKGFTAISRVAAQSGTGILNYFYSDRDAPKSNATVIYYRLKMVDIDGHFEYSITTAIKINNGSELVITKLQNPIVSGPILFTIVSNLNRPVVIRITDMWGKEIVRKEQLLKTGENGIKLSTTSLLRGAYFLTVIKEDGARQGIKLIKN